VTGTFRLLPVGVEGVKIVTLFIYPGICAIITDVSHGNLL
jgi:hypothetical protein